MNHKKELLWSLRVRCQLSSAGLQALRYRFAPGIRIPGLDVWAKAV